MSYSIDDDEAIRWWVSQRRAARYGTRRFTAALNRARARVLLDMHAAVSATGQRDGQSASELAPVRRGRSAARIVVSFAGELLRGEDVCRVVDERGRTRAVEFAFCPRPEVEQEEQDRDILDLADRLGSLDSEAAAVAVAIGEYKRFGRPAADIFERELVRKSIRRKDLVSLEVVRLGPALALLPWMELHELKRAAGILHNFCQQQKAAADDYLSRLQCFTRQGARTVQRDFVVPN